MCGQLRLSRLGQAADVHADMLVNSNVRRQKPLISALRNASPKISDLSKTMTQKLTAQESPDVVESFYNDQLAYIAQAPCHDQSEGHALCCVLHAGPSHMCPPANDVQWR